MYRRIILPLMVLGIFVSGSRAQEKALVFDFESIGVDEQTITAASQIFRSELDATGKFSLIHKKDAETMLAAKGVTDFTCHETECAVNYGFIVGAQKVVLGSITRLGEGLTVDVRLVDVAARDVVFTDRFFASSLDDLRIALNKLANAVATGQKIESETTRYAITEEETEEPRRKKTNITAGFFLGGSFPTGDSYSDVGFLFAFGVPIRIEARNLVVETDFGLSVATINPDSSVGELDRKSLLVFMWDMGMRYVFNYRADFSPFVGGGLGIHFISESKQKETYYGDTETEYIRGDEALALHVNAGVYAFQSYDVHASFELRYEVVFTDAFAASSGYSQQIGILAAITFKADKKKTSSCGTGGGGVFRGGCLR